MQKKTAATFLLVFLVLSGCTVTHSSATDADVLLSPTPIPVDEVVTATPEEVMFTLSSPAFLDGGFIDEKYTYKLGRQCSGENYSPPLEWKGMPEGTQSLLLTVIDPDGGVQTLPADQVGFGYRRTRLGGAIVSSATLRLRRDDPDRSRERLLEIWRYKRETQPLGEHSAGCVFKNPPGGSAGQLIDQAGLKGRRIGGAQVSTRHANFIVAQEGATAKDVLDLIDVVRQEVAQRFGIELELEIEVWGAPVPAMAT